MQHVLTDSYFNFSQQTFNAEKPVHVHEQYKTYRKQEKNLYFHSFQFHIYSNMFDTKYMYTY